MWIMRRIIAKQWQKYEYNFKWKNFFISGFSYITN